MVGAVGIVLCLEAECAATGILHALLAYETAIEEVAGIELNTGLVGEHFHEDASVGIVECTEALGEVAVCVENPVVVIAHAIHNLLVCLVVDAVANGSGGAEVEWCALYCKHFACNCNIGIYGCKLVGVEHQHLVEAVLRTVAAEIEVAVVGQVQHCGLVCVSKIIDDQCIVFGQSIGYLYVQVAGIAVFAIGACCGELDDLAVLLIGFPNAVVESNRATAMEAVGAIIDGQLICVAIESELTLGNAVAVTADEGTEVAALRAILHVVGNVVMAETYVLHVAVLVGNHNADNTSTEVSETHLHACIVLEDIESR